MLVDSHCHLNYPELQDNLQDYLAAMQQNQVIAALCVSTTPDNIPQVVALANAHENLFASVGVHPDEILDEQSNAILTKEFLLEYAKNKKVVAIGETGLDYYHNNKDKDNKNNTDANNTNTSSTIACNINDKAIDHIVDMSWQHERFILHIDVAKTVQLPLIVHTRNSVADTLHIMKEHDAMSAGAVMHCFTESLEYAKKFLDLGFYISISGIVTFKNAKVVQEVASYVPLDRLLIETDAPFLAPVPYRGKLNHPALVKHTAEYIADLKHISLEALGVATTNNFFQLFKKAVIV
jgi:TatD DNase family protein